MSQPVHGRLMPIPLDQLNAMDLAGFVAALGGIYE